MKDNRSAYNSDIYDEHIVSVLPYYREYHGQVIDLVRTMEITKPKWLDTGCGTGTLAAEALKVCPDILFTLCDPSEQMLNKARAKLCGKEIRFMNISSDRLSFDSEFDIVTAIQSHHYFSLEGREAATKNCYKALRKSGVFITFENVKMSTEESDSIALKRWVKFLEEHSNPPEDVKMHVNRRGVEIFPITIEQHIELLRKCGFRSVNLLWASYLQAGFWAIK